MRRYLDANNAVTAVLLLVMVGSLARSIEQGRWTDGLDVLFPIAVLGVLVGVLLAGSNLGTVRAHLVGVLAGLLVVTWQTGSLLPAEALENGNRFGVVWARFREWLSVVIEGGASYDQLLFVFTMGAIIWFLAYNGAWFVLRYGWVWWALLPTGLVMLVNLGYTIRPNTRPFVLFLLASMLLMIHTHLAQRRARWEQEGLGYEGGMLPKFLMLGSVLSLVLLALAWQGPSRGLTRTARAIFAQVERPWERVQDRWENAFAFLYPSSGGGGRRSGIGGGFTSFSDNFELGGPLRLGTRTVFTAEGEPRQYWRGVVYDEYTGRGWGVGGGPEVYPPVQPVQGKQLDQRVAQTKLPKGVYKVDQAVTVVLPVGTSVFAADTPVRFDRPSQWQLSPVLRQQTMRLDEELPASTAVDRKRAYELNELRRLIQAIGPQRVRQASLDGGVEVTPRVRSVPAINRRGDVTTPAPEATPALDEAEARQSEERLTDELIALNRRGIQASFRYQRGAAPVIRYAYYEANQHDLQVVTAQQAARKGETYKVTSFVPNPTDEQLNAERRPVPEWVRDRYLETGSLPERVRARALELTQGAKTTHEKAQAIELYLRSLKYKENMPLTPPGRDFVDYFLFDRKEGYCTSFASAMAVMLRSLDVPARVVTGFAPGKYDTRLGRYVVTEAQAHMWPQVYYPTYGWVNYEPTPIRDLVSRTEGVGGGAYNPGIAAGTRPGDDLLQKNLDGNTMGGSIGAAGSSRLPAPVRFVLTILLLMAVLAVLALLAYFISLVRLRGLRGARRQYAKLLQVGSVLGVRPALSHTPAEHSARLETAMPGARSSVREITSRYVSEVFGRQTRDHSDLDGEWKAVATQAARVAPGRVVSAIRGLRGSVFLGRLRRG
ncbi:MAG: transglutaminase domain-containing protein [Chloroflexota bacterium]|nr:transglutaminase domain-containing protein [Chloroflexota bacterium]